MYLNFFFFLIIFVFAHQSCKTKKSTPPTTTLPSPGQIDPNTPSNKDFSLTVTKQESNSADIKIGSLPKDAQISCFLNSEKLSECKDNLKISLVPGMNTFEVHAFKDGVIVGFQDIRIQNGDATSSTAALDIAKRRDPLLLVAANDKYRDGSPHLRSKDFSFDFKFANAPSCDAKFFCSYDQRDHYSWRPCSTKNQHTIPKILVAKGIQFLNVRAECEQRVGPVLKTYWFGVDDDYEWLKLDRLKSGRNQKEFFILQNTSDCPENLLKFQCANAGQNNFTSCKNIQSNISSGFKIRASCDGKNGPIHVAS